MSKIKDKMPLSKDISFNSLEFQALINNDISFVEKNFNEYVNLKDYWLTVASCYCDLPMNQFLVSKGCNPNFNGTENFSNAIFQDKLDVVEFYFSKNCYTLGQDDNHLGGAIMNAVENDSLEMLKYLINLGCDIHLDSDYAFNRGIAENSIKCISYLLENYSMSYHPDISYNIEKIIANNHFKILDYILKHIKKPLTFNFSKEIHNLFTNGHPEVFDIFVYYNLIDEDLFVNNFENILYYFPFKQDLIKHFQNNYPDWFKKGINKTIDNSKLKNILEFLFSQKYFDKFEGVNFTKKHLSTLLKIPFIYNFTDLNPYFISEILLTNLNNKNNIDLLKDNFKPDFIKENKIQSILDIVLPQIIGDEKFNDVLNIVFQKPFNTHLENLSKIQSYYKLNSKIVNNFNTKTKKI